MPTEVLDRPDADVKETRTARKKRLRAERADAVNHEIARAARASIERMKNKLETRLCSPWWAEHVANARGPYLPSAECRCRHCRGQRKWPSPVVSVRRLSYECHVLRMARLDRVDRWRQVSKSESIQAGLHIIRRRGLHADTPRGITVMLGQCERCEGLRPYGERFCMACKSVVVGEMTKAGYFG